MADIELNDFIAALKDHGAYDENIDPDHGIVF